MRSPCSPVSPTTTPKVASVAAAIGISGTCTNRMAAVWNPIAIANSAMTTYFDELVSIPCHRRDRRTRRDQRGLDQQHAFDDTVATALTTGEPLGRRSHRR